MAASKNPRVRLFHIRDEIEGVVAAIKGVTFDDYQRSFLLRRAVERAIQIISEAAKSLPDELIGRYPSAPWSGIIGIGNVMRHEYHYVDDGRVWEIATLHLPQLREVVRQMLADLT